MAEAVPGADDGTVLHTRRHFRLTRLATSPLGRSIISIVFFVACKQVALNSDVTIQHV